MPRTLPPRLAPVLFAFILSALMSLAVSCVATLRTVGLGEGFLFQWLTAWLPAWAVAFPLMMALAPRVRRFVEGLVAPREG